MFTKAEFSARVNTLMNQELYHCRNSFMKAGFIMGGAIASTQLGERPRDFDIYFEDPEVLKKALIGVLGVRNPTYTKLEDGTYKWEGIANRNYTNFHITENAISWPNHKIQIILKFIGTPEEIADTYDYEHCKAYWQPDLTKNDIYNLGSFKFLGDSAECIARKLLKYNADSSYYKLSAMLRMVKFIKRGWNIDPGSLLLLVDDLKNVNLNDIDTLRFELQGFYGLPKPALENCLKNFKDLNTLATQLSGYY